MAEKKDIVFRNAKPEAKARKIADEKGLFLYVTPEGRKYWRFKYRFGGKEKLLALGVYDDVTLAKARVKRDEARKLLADGIDPGEHKKVMKQVADERSANSFEVVAREWFVKYSSNWVKSHADKIIQRFVRDIFPWIGDKPITEVTPPVLLSVIRRIEDRGALETAHRALSNCGQVFRYAIATGRAERDFSQDLKGALPPVKTKHFAAQTDPKRFGQLLRVFEDYEGSLIVRCALRLAPLVFVRPGELRHAKWEDIDFDTAQWSYIVTKTDTPHIVPLATQAITILKELHPFTCNSAFVFPSARSNARPMSDNAILGALRRLGISKEEASGHGFRATARTLLDEVLGVRPDIIEHQLAHAVRDPNGRAYNRTAHLPERRKMMQDWADYLDCLSESH
ncbi:Integrase [Legionella donaldsonii]|uniref:Integrase n=1 Tax=Legionella donaldsonii TaxID=45060 RepID=A0A378JBX0_9GAMM|nr:integrase arm-type DNA-binding domain-containing protein [Legionella donaldsonii]STX44491.1 Integrase [Legionella donaldsonii]